jgi:putative flippase GtrA
LFFAVNAIGVAIAEVPVGLTYPLRLDGAVAYNIALYCGIALATVFRYWSYRTWVWPTGALSSAGAPLPVPAHSQLASSMQQGKLGQVLRGRCWRLVLEFASFSVVPGCAWLVTDAIFKLLVMQAGVEPLAWGAVSVAVATVASFTGNRYWTFRQRQRTTLRREGFRYLVLTGAGLMIQIAFLQLTVGSQGLHDKLSPNDAVMLALGVGIVFRYWLCRTWVWRARQSAPSIVT